MVDEDRANEREPHLAVSCLAKCGCAQVRRKTLRAAGSTAVAVDHDDKNLGERLDLADSLEQRVVVAFVESEQLIQLDVGF